VEGDRGEGESKDLSVRESGAVFPEEPQAGKKSAGRPGGGKRNPEGGAKGGRRSEDEKGGGLSRNNSCGGEPFGKYRGLPGTVETGHGLGSRGATL